MRSRSWIFKKKPWSSLVSRHGEHLPVYRPAPGPGYRAPALPGAVRGPERLLRVATAPVAHSRASLASGGSERVCLAFGALRYSPPAGRTARARPPSGPLAHSAHAGCCRPTGPPGTTQQPRSFVLRTTDSDPSVRAAPNRLLDQPAPTAPN